MSKVPQDRYAGLTEAEAARRLLEHGPNLIREARRRGLIEIARGTLRQPMFLLLLAAASLYLAFGGLGEGLFLLAGALVSIGLVVFQEARSERALAALNALAEPIVRVIREGKQRLVPARELVPGDLFVVAEGNRLPADALLIGGDALSVDESALTGEAAAVDKCPGAEAGEDAQLSAGTLIVRGHGVATATLTGAATRFGRIGTALAAISEEPTLLQRNVGRLIARLGVLALIFCLLVTASYGWIRHDWFAGALAGITMAIALLPEEFPMVLAVFMAIGAWRLARQNVLVRHSAVIETLGATTLLCVDKTGTLTENRMTLVAAWRDGQLHELGKGTPPAGIKTMLATARLASALHSHDPMDAAVHAVTPALPEATPIRSYPVQPSRLAFVQVWNAGRQTIYAAKGAPEAIFAMCRLDGPRADAAEEAVTMLANRGQRLLAVAEARLPADSGADPAELPFSFLGLLTFEDPVRGDVRGALAEARRAGIQVAMVTGDYPATALAIARDAGIETEAGVVTGADIERGVPFPAETRVFARVMPEQKLALVERFKAAGHVVAMTGDGINDAPALAAAHIGVAMGRRGTDVAREAADLILLDDRFASIIGGIRLGRRIFANLRRAMTFIVAIHVPIAGLALLPILLGLPPILYPMHVVLLELLVDPLCSLAFEGEPGDAEAMARPPRPAAELLFGPGQMLSAAIQGVALLAAVFGLYLWMIGAGLSEDVARTAAFCALVLGNLGLALADASGGSARLLDRRRTAFWIIGALALFVLALCLLIPPLRAILRFEIPAPWFLAAALAIGLGTAALAGIDLRRRLIAAIVSGRQA
jgi:Ca2+-transporting ATPase